MSNKPPSSFHNTHAEASVLASVFKHPDHAPVLQQLSVEDFFHTEFGLIFEKMRELAVKGIHINTATVNWKITDAEMLSFAHDDERAFSGLIAVIKECSRRRRMVAALGLDLEKAESISTPSLVLEFSKKVKEAQAQAKDAQSYIDEYIPSLNKQAIEWATLPTEDDILAIQGSSLDYIVDEVVPKRRVTMLFGQEKSGKSIVALDLCKHAANGKPWLNRHTAKTPCLYLDLEDGIVGSYIDWLRGVGEEKVRFLTIRTQNGIPALDDPGLLAMCAEIQPLIVLDSLHKLFARNKEGKFGSAWQSSDYEPVLEKIRQLCVAGATVILIHHSTKSDEEKYRDSSAIGANVDFLFAVIGDDPDGNGVKRIHLKGQPSRGAQPPTIHILAFPHIIEHGHLCLDAGLEGEEEAAARVVQEIETNGPATGVRKLLERLSGWKARRETKAAAITKAVALGWLVKAEGGEFNLGKRPDFGWETVGKQRFPQSSGNSRETDNENGSF